MAESADIVKQELARGLASLSTGLLLSSPRPLGKRPPLHFPDEEARLRKTTVSPSSPAWTLPEPPARPASVMARRLLARVSFEEVGIPE